MAEREKRRATTFRTSRGAIVNVSYPDIYIAPSVVPGDVISQDEMRDILSLNVPRGRTSGVVWQYGGGVVKGAMEKLIHPRYAEETPDGTVLISDFEGNRVFEVKKDSLETIWEYSIVRPQVVHRLADGTTIITSVSQIIQVNPGGNVVWSYQIPGVTAPFEVYDALKIDGEVVITYWTGVWVTAIGHVRKINYATQATVWDVVVGVPSVPRAIFHIVNQHAGKPSFAPGMDGDYLIADAVCRVFELRDSDQAIVWQYGVLNEGRHAYNRLRWCNAAVIGWSDINFPLMFISESDHGRVFAINRLGHTQWQYGWSYPGALWASGRGPLLGTPDNVNFTRNGTMLISDSGGSKVVEVLLTKAEVPREWAHLFWQEAISDVLAHNSLVAETGWYPWKNKLITVENGLNQNVSVQVQGSRMAAFTNPYNIGAAVTVNTVTTQAIVVSDPVQFLRIQVTAAGIPTSGSLTAIVEMFDDG